MKVSKEIKRILDFVWKNRCVSMDESNKFKEESDKILNEANKFKAEIDSLTSDINKVGVEYNRLMSEHKKFFLESERKKQEADKLWHDTLLEFCGDVKYEKKFDESKKDYSYSLESGEIFS